MDTHGIAKRLTRRFACPRTSPRWSVIVMALLMPVPSNSPNPCQTLNSGVSEKRWGDDCSQPCHCRNNRACSFDGACLGGCLQGYVHAPQTRRCVLPSQSNDTFSKAFPKNVSLTGRYKKGTDMMDRPEATRGRYKKGTDLSDGREATVYRFAPPEICSPRPVGGYEKLWRMSTNKPILLESIHVIFDTGLNSNDTIFAKIFISNHSQLTFQVGMRIHQSDDNRATASTRVERFTIGDSIEIRSKSTDGEANCSAGVIAAVVVYGQAVCPYRKWGANCEKECRCPCKVVECHPSTGDCRTRGFACSPGMFGPTCLRKCSENCSGSPLECHVLSGVCKRCFGGDHTGVQCERRLTDAELAEHRSACERFKEDAGLKMDTMAFHRKQVQTETKDSGPPKADTSVLVAMATAVVLVTFVVACLIYFMLIRHCAQARLKKIAEIDKERKRRISMMSYSELQKEYMDMTGRSRSDLKASRSISSGHQVQVLPRTATLTSASADNSINTTSTSTRETSLLGMFRWNRRLVSIIKGGPDHHMGDHGV